MGGTEANFQLEDTMGVTENVSASVCDRQLGRDGLRNRKRIPDYKVVLVNVGRSLDVGTLYKYLHLGLDHSLKAWNPIGKYRCRSNVSKQLIFQSPTCPPQLANVSKIGKMDTYTYCIPLGMRQSPASLVENLDTSRTNVTFRLRKGIKETVFHYNGVRMKQPQVLDVPLQVATRCSTTSPS